MPSPLQSVILIVCLLTNGVFFVKHLQTWGKPATYLALIDLHKSDESLIKAIRQVIIPPPSPLLPYNFTQAPPNLGGQLGQPQFIDTLLGGLRNGFFIECGSYDGEELSNTLLFEMERNWTGLLIEPNPLQFDQLLTKGRKASLLNAGISITNESTLESFWGTKFAGGLTKTLGKDKHLQNVKSAMELEHFDEAISYQAITFPFESVLMAIGNPVVDLLALDVEGAEADILRTISFERHQIRLLLLEYNFEPANLEEFKTILEPVGYKLVHNFSNQDALFSLEEATNFNFDENI